MVEDTVVKSTHKDEKGGDLEEAEIETLVQIPRGENIRFPGSDVKAGDLVFSKHTILDGLGGDIGTLAFIGKKEVRVCFRGHCVPLTLNPRDRFTSHGSPLWRS
jgi:gephyrin